MLFEVEGDVTNIANPTGENARIKVFGVGGGGGNSVDTMIERGLSGVDFYVANTDAQNLKVKQAPNKIQLGETATRGLGAGAQPEIGRQSAEQTMDQIAGAVADAELVFVTAGMGGGTGTGAAPVIAQAARDAGALTIGVVTRPFTFEGSKRQHNALAGIAELEKACDTVLVIPNDRILQLAKKGTPAKLAFKISDQVLLHAVSGISNLITHPGQINLDYADIRKVMKDGGKAMMGASICEGEDRARRAMEEALNSPLIEDARVEGARSVLVNITGASDKLTIEEINEAMQLLTDMIGNSDVEIIFGTSFDEALGDKVAVTVIAAGFAQKKAASFGIPDRTASVSGPRNRFDGSISDLTRQSPSPEMIMKAARNDVVATDAPRVAVSKAAPSLDDHDYDMPAYMRLTMQ